MPNILVIGDPMIDRYVYGAVNRLNPEAPCVLLDEDVTKEKNVAGGALNVANILTKSSRVWFIGPWVEEFNTLAPKVFRLFNTAADNFTGSASLLKTRYMTGDTTLLRVDSGNICQYRDDINEVLVDLRSLNQHQHNILDTIDAVIVSDYNKGAVTEEILAEVAKRLPPSAIVVIDTKRPSLDIYTPFLEEGFNPYLTVNRAEWQALDKAWMPPIAIVSLGSEGIAIYEDGNEITRYKAEAGTVRSVIGAGDVVTARFTLEMLLKHDYNWAAEQAEAAAARAVTLPRTSYDV